ncbi:hypothetical protein J2Y45_001240 [Dyadobacter sp. BE34]|uniref:Lipoprotein n=1 Tax=Dyadobacter fermentans TaxID=94254 RepID=A0ABU1QS33_9BACT|nr:MULTISPECIES: hypothetical protein [Dyadobacter]MDR6803971.1 hypothetical protein [Dyadobacter fermentans]MDR7041711.1 hypothetical protein [Dyadobacter sp. BE242]MDR7196114.1 hypothetical protein [Dyadobacter sp. BE34]MDR7213341.1 hypothetical protein [Dyadobacter sp. BE31]MDR7261520.1 hypothetical protein [Dyadobacter sp. BE32]
MPLSYMNQFQIVKKYVADRLFPSLLATITITGCLFERGEFQIADVSQNHYFTDSAWFHPRCCVATLVTGKLDAPALVVVQSYLIGGLNDSLYLPKGNVYVKSQQDLYVYRKIVIKYFPGEAKKGSLTIKTSIY